MKEFSIRTSQHTQFLEITGDIQRAVGELGVKGGVCTVFVPHTTAGIVINENADPDVMQDIGAMLDNLVPWKGNYRHSEGNAAITRSVANRPVETG